MLRTTAKLSVAFSVALLLALATFPTTANVGNPAADATQVAVPAASPEDTAGSAVHAEQATPEHLDFDGSLKPVANGSCGSACQAQYLACTVECDNDPYPGCYNDCRLVFLNACYLACF